MNDSDPSKLSSLLIPSKQNWILFMDQVCLHHEESGLQRQKKTVI